MTTIRVLAEGSKGHTVGTVTVINGETERVFADYILGRFDGERRFVMKSRPNARIMICAAGSTECRTLNVLQGYATINAGDWVQFDNQWTRFQPPPPEADYSEHIWFESSAPPPR
ncbi:hypothetical protein ACQEU6_07170 [Spirillospora sp. CA-108201]